MTHWSKPTGVAAIGVVYLGLGALVLWGPGPVKAIALGILVPAPPYIMETFLFGFGYALAADWGHESGEISKMDVFTGLVGELVDDCDPFHPDYHQRCLGYAFPF